MRRPSSAHRRNLARAEAARHDLEATTPLVPLLVQSRQELADLNAFFGFPPHYTGRLPIPLDAPTDARGVMTVPTLLRFLSENSCHT
jgi:hypothetical protein